MGRRVRDGDKRLGRGRIDVKLYLEMKRRFYLVDKDADEEM